MQTNILQTLDYESEATKARLAFAAKRYATEGKGIPLKKNWKENWCLLPANFDNIFEEYLNFQLNKEDVVIITFMKSGTTWMQECGWLLMNNLDFEKSQEGCVLSRSPFLDYKGLVPSSPGPVEASKHLTGPRLVKTHMPANLLPLDIWQKKPKIIYVARNVKDVIVSSYHFCKNTNMWLGNNIAEYVEDFLNNEIFYAPYWSHVVDFWQMRHEPYIFFVTYEEMQHDLADVLQRLCTFLERPQLTKEELEKTIEHLSFESMKRNKTTNLTQNLKDKLPQIKEDFQFMRRGIVGSFKDELTPELIDKVNKWSADQLGKHGLTESDIFGKL